MDDYLAADVGTLIDHAAPAAATLRGDHSAATLFRFLDDAAEAHDPTIAPDRYAQTVADRLTPIVDWLPGNPATWDGGAATPAITHDLIMRTVRYTLPPWQPSVVLDDVRHRAARSLNGVLGLGLSFKRR